MNGDMAGKAILPPVSGAALEQTLPVGPNFYKEAHLVPSNTDALYTDTAKMQHLTMPLYADSLGPAYNGPRYPWKQAFTDGVRRAKYEPQGPGFERGWHDADVLPVPMLMPDLCQSLRGSGLTLADVTQAIYEVAEIRKVIGPDYDGEDVRRAMILSRLEARLHGARPETVSR